MRLLLVTLVVDQGVIVRKAQTAVAIGPNAEQRRGALNRVWKRVNDVIGITDVMGRGEIGVYCETVEAAVGSDEWKLFARCRRADHLVPRFEWTEEFSESTYVETSREDH